MGTSDVVVALAAAALAALAGCTNAMPFEAGSGGATSASATSSHASSSSATTVGSTSTASSGSTTSGAGGFVPTCMGVPLPKCVDSSFSHLNTCDRGQPDGTPCSRCRDFPTPDGVCIGTGCCAQSS